MSNSREMVLCPQCLGHGNYYKRVSMHGSELVPCDRCDGKGRLLKITIITYEKLSD